MNILIPHSWLTEHLETDATPEEIQSDLSLCGPSVERIYDRQGEPVYDIEVTTNRVDSMCVRGIAREAAVILKQFGKQANFLERPELLEKPRPTGEALPLPKIVNDPKLCKRVLCAVLDGVERTPTPDWMAKRLEQTDQNVHDSIIDITNYITHELGHPCHAFDYDAVMASGGVIIVKEATPGKKFKTLDGLEFTTVGGEVVFENEAGDIIDLPAIKGTANTSISDKTKRVLLWIENLDAEKVRFASMTHSIRTVAAQLSEKHVDPALGEIVLYRGIQLYQELCNAKLASQIFDEFPGKTSLGTVELSLEKVKQYLGLEIPSERIEEILRDLGCQVQLKGRQLSVTPPTFRHDLAIPADIIEEIARVYGYHELPSTMMSTEIPLEKPSDFDSHLESRLKRFLAAIGMQEVYTYSMVSEEIALESGYSLDEQLKLKNPLTEDRVYLRRSLLPSLEEVLANNPNEQDLSIFEFANVYHPRTEDLPEETTQIGMLSTRGYRAMRGIVESLLDQLFLGSISVEPHTRPLPDYSQSGTISAGSVELGTIGITRQGRAAVSLSLEALTKNAKTHPTYEALPKAEPVVEDLTFTIPKKTLVGPVLETFKSTTRLVRSVELVSVYNQNYSFRITYAEAEHTPSPEAVTAARKQLVVAVANEHQGVIVGTV
ncbi:phenylalanine--tRNA ligase subunit beta [Candidatus Woesebacteria bacterium]|nr:phenylalanine--tRNA ligase subunit beta [Candidatus Woesebacteria bacterium]